MSGPCLTHHSTRTGAIKPRQPVNSNVRQKQLRGEYTMKKPAWLLLLLIVPLLAQAQEHRSPYSGRQEREIKALSANEVQAYLVVE